MGVVRSSTCGRSVWSWVVGDYVFLLNTCWCSCEVVCVPLSVKLCVFLYLVLLCV